MSKLKPLAKAIVPAFLTLVAALAQSFIAGKFDRTSATIAAVGLIGAAVTYFVPNAAGEVQVLETALSTQPVSALAPQDAAEAALPVSSPPDPVQAVPAPPEPAPVPPTLPAA